MPVEISAIGNVETVAFIGSEKAFGQFHPESLLIDSDGVSHRASEIVEENLIGKCRFENAVHVDGIAIGRDALDGLWTELENAAILANGSHLILPAKGQKADGVEVRSMHLYEPDEPASQEFVHRFVQFEENELKSTPSKKVGVTISGMIEILFEETEDGVRAFDRPDYLWCLWQLLLSEESTGHSGNLRYDSLQHTSRVYLTSDKVRLSSGFSKGGTAFYKAQPDVEYEIRWEESSWNPISSGFILSSG